MFNVEELMAILSLINRATVSGQEVDIAYALKVKISTEVKKLQDTKSEEVKKDAKDEAKE